jgi:hypothetical protein
MDGDWIQAGVFLGVMALVVWRGSRAVDDGAVHRWERRFSVTLPDELRAEAARRLRRDRVLRTSAIAAGLLAASSPAYMNLVEPERSSDLANPATGQAWLLAAALGALAAEMLVSHIPAGPRRAALVRRRVGDYVGLRWVWAIGVLAVVAFLAATVGALGDAPDRGWWWVHAGGAVLAAAATGYGLQVVRDRAMAAPDGPGRDLDESLRADGAHHLVGAGLALAAASAAGGLGLAFHSVPAVGAVAQLVALMSLGTWWTLARSAPWSVRGRRLATT